MKNNNDALFKMIERACSIVLDLLKSEGYDKDSLRCAAAGLVVKATITYIEITLEFGGESVYISKELLSRDQKIKNAFRGNNVAEIVANLGVSRATVYRALKRPKKGHKGDIVEKLVSGLVRKIDEIDLKKYDVNHLSSIYLRFSASDALKRHLKLDP